MRSPALAIALLLTFLAFAATASANGVDAVAEVYDHEWKVEGARFIVGDVVQFSGELSTGSNLSYIWDMDNTTDSDGNGNHSDDIDATGPNATWTYLVDNNRTLVTLRVSNGSATDEATLLINVSENWRPNLFIVSFSALVGKTVDLIDHISVNDSEGRVLTLLIELDNETDISWTSRNGGDTEHVYTVPGTFGIGATLSDGFHTVRRNGTVTVLPAGTVKDVNKRYSDDDHVLTGAYFAYRLDLNDGDRVKVIYRVVTGAGMPLFLIMDSASYARFSDHGQRRNVTLMDDLSEPNGTRSEMISWTSDGGIIFIIIDNGYQEGPGNETVSFLITIDIDRKRETPGSDAGLSFLAVLVALVLVTRRKGASSGE